MFTILKNLFTRKPNRLEGVDLIYTSNDGTKWYSCDNVTELPAARVLAAEANIRLGEANLTKEILLQYIAKLKQFANEGKIVDMFTLLNNLEQRTMLITEEKTLKTIAATIFVIEGEDISKMTKYWFDKKMEILDKDEECAGFFLQRAFALLQKSTELYEANVRTYLKETRNAVAELNRLITMP